MSLLQSVDAGKPRVLDQVRDAIAPEYPHRGRLRRLGSSLHHHHKRHPRDMGKVEITRFLTWPATHRRVAASTQNQALCALLFLYRPQDESGLQKAIR